MPGPTPRRSPIGASHPRTAACSDPPIRWRSRSPPIQVGEQRSGAEQHEDVSRHDRVRGREGHAVSDADPLARPRPRAAADLFVRAASARAAQGADAQHGARRPRPDRSRHALRNSQEELVLREYAAYRIYNLLTPRSFRARLVKATYVERRRRNRSRRATRCSSRTKTMSRSGWKDGSSTRRGDVQSRGRRHDGADVAVRIHDRQHRHVDVQEAQRPPRPDPGRPALPGAVRLRLRRPGGRVHAIPAKHFGLASVRDRLYLGPCRTAAESSLLRENARGQGGRDGDLRQLPVSTGYRNNARNYLEQFYRTIIGRAT